MARYLSEQQNATDVQTFNLLAGGAINANDIVQLSPDGRAYPIECTDYAAVANCTYGTNQTNAATGMIVAQTQVVAATTAAYYRQALLRGNDGSIYTFTAQSTSGGLMLSKYSASGALLAKADIETGATPYYAHQMFFLSNGNICVFASRSGTNTISFAIYDTNLTAIKSLATIATAASAYSSACGLSGGGFAVVFHPSATPLASQLCAYDNAGNVVLAPTAIWTRTGTSNVQYHQMAQLSDGNLVITVGSANTSSSIGLFHGIVSISGGSVLPFVNMDTTARDSLHELSVMDGYYAVCAYCGTQQKAFVFTNSGILQGSPFSAAGGGASPAIKLLNDGSNFFMIWPRDSDSKEVLTKIPVTGTGYITTDVTLAGTSQFNTKIDAFYERGLIVVVSQNTTTNAAPVLWVIDASTGILLSKSGTSFGVAPGTTSGLYHRVIPGGDCSFICLYDYTTTASTNLYIGKYANTAILGIAQQSANGGNLVRVAGVLGAYAANYARGTASKAFDHSATSINGNKGTLLNYGCVLKGL